LITKLVKQKGRNFSKNIGTWKETYYFLRKKIGVTKRAKSLYHWPILVLEWVLGIVNPFIQQNLLFALNIRRFLAGRGSRSGKASGTGHLFRFGISIQRLDISKCLRGVVDLGHFEKLHGPWEVVPPAIVLENDRCPILSLRMRFEREALVHSALGVLQGNLRGLAASGQP
jgi:hypothetical protein